LPERETVADGPEALTLPALLADWFEMIWAKEG
jgi:hypothetical protein